MIKVLQYAPGFLNGGIESRMLDWYRNIDREKIQFILVKLNDIDDTENIQEFVALGGKVYSFHPLSLQSVIVFSKRIENVLSTEKVDIVHVHDVSSGFFVLREAKKLRIKCRILHSRTTAYLPGEKHLIVKNVLRKLSPWYANFYFACSVEAGAWGIGDSYKKKIRVIKNGIQVDRFAFNKETRGSIRKGLGIENNKVIGCVCRINAQKNIAFLLDIVKKLYEEDTMYRLVIVGDGDRTILENYCEGIDLSDFVVVSGIKKNVWDYYAAFDVFCSPSLYEGFGTTAIESQASGLPTLVSEFFPETVEVSPLIKRLPIDNVNVWINNIKDCIGKRESQKGIDCVNKNGYNAVSVAKELERFYIQKA